MSIIEPGRRKAGIIILLRRALHLFLLAHVHRTPKQRSAMYIYIYIDETESRAPSSTVEDLPFELLTCSNFFPPPSALPSFFLGRLSDQSESNGSRSISRRRVPSSRGSPRVSWNKVRLIIAGFSFFPTRERAGKRGRQRERERDEEGWAEEIDSFSRNERNIRDHHRAFSISSSFESLPCRCVFPSSISTQTLPPLSLILSYTRLSYFPLYIRSNSVAIDGVTTLRRRKLKGIEGIKSKRDVIGLREM